MVSLAGQPRLHHKLYLLQQKGSQHVKNTKSFSYLRVHVRAVGVQNRVYFPRSFEVPAHDLLAPLL